MSHCVWCRMEISGSLSATQIKKHYKSLKMMKVVKGSFTFLVVTIILLTYNTGFRKDNENESIMTSLWITNNYNFKEKKIGFEGYCKWKQISLFLLSLTLHFVLILMSLIMAEPGRWFCQRAKPYALSWKPWDFFFHPCTQTSSLLAYVLEIFSVVFECLWNKTAGLKMEHQIKRDCVSSSVPCLLHHREVIPWNSTNRM